MKSLITAAVFTLAASNAAAFEFYAGFSGPDNDPSYSPAHEIKSPQFSPVATHVEVALDLAKARISSGYGESQSRTQSVL